MGQHQCSHSQADDSHPYAAQTSRNDYARDSQAERQLGPRTAYWAATTVRDRYLAESLTIGIGPNTQALPHELHFEEAAPEAEDQQF
jgi:hypothetical protein